MAITKETEIAKIEIVGGWNIQIASDIVITENNAEIGRSRQRHVLQPYSSSTKDSDDNWTHTNTDISAEATEVQAVANAVWTDAVKAKYKTWAEAQEI